mmetsp:Transcript_17444/g.42337  ORF Transcript_17444/g.42337 Transcript_17444/m.42337 type:complete len:237 (-) Transcript_17444:284-994(-)
MVHVLVSVQGPAERIEHVVPLFAPLVPRTLPVRLRAEGARLRHPNSFASEAAVVLGVPEGVVVDRDVDGVLLVERLVLGDVLGLVLDHDLLVVVLRAHRRQKALRHRLDRRRVLALRAPGRLELLQLRVMQLARVDRPRPLAVVHRVNVIIPPARTHRTPAVVRQPSSVALRSSIHRLSHDLLHVPWHVARREHRSCRCSISAVVQHTRGSPPSVILKVLPALLPECWVFEAAVIT